jgi:hypothetical protein
VKELRRRSCSGVGLASASSQSDVRKVDGTAAPAAVPVAGESGRSPMRARRWVASASAVPLIAADGCCEVRVGAAAGQPSDAVVGPLLAVGLPSDGKDDMPAFMRPAPPSCSGALCALRTLPPDASARPPTLVALTSDPCSFSSAEDALMDDRRFSRKAASCKAGATGVAWCGDARVQSAGVSPHTLGVARRPHLGLAAGKPSCAG